MKTVSTYVLRDNLSDYLNEVAKTEIPLLISKFGKPIAVISPYKEARLPKIDEFFGFLGKGESGEKFLARVRRSKEEKIRTESLKNR